MRIKNILLATLVCCFSHALTWAETVLVYIPPDVLADYQLFLDGRNPLKISDYVGNKARRDVIEVVLFQQALARMGNRFKVQFIEQPDYGAMLDGLESGDAIASVTSLWRRDLSPRWDNLFITAAVIDRGQFEAGFYTSATNQAAIQSQDMDDLKALRGVSSESWVIDWQTLQDFGANVRHVDTWSEMVAEVFASKSDYLLAPFQPTPDLSLTLPEGTLVPIPNVKISLVDTRHFAVSRSHPLGREFNTALHRGLMRMKKDGLVTKAYSDSGFLNTQVSRWREVNAINN